MGDAKRRKNLNPNYGKDQLLPYGFRKSTGNLLLAEALECSILVCDRLEVLKREGGLDLKICAASRLLFAKLREESKRWQEFVGMTAELSEMLHASEALLDMFGEDSSPEDLEDLADRIRFDSLLETVDEKHQLLKDGLKKVEHAEMILAEFECQQEMIQASMIPAELLLNSEKVGVLS